MVNLHILDLNPLLSAQYSCDQHVGKIPSEVVQSALIVLSVLEKALYEAAKQDGIAEKEMTKDYSKIHMNPLPRWMALCVANFVDTLIRAKAMVEEYTFRYNKSHKSHAKLVWLLDHASEMQLHGAVWDEWLRRERIGKNTNGVSYEGVVVRNGCYATDITEKKHSQEIKRKKDFINELTMPSSIAWNHNISCPSRRCHPYRRTSWTASLL